VKGPFPKLPYTANMKKKIGMLAGGTGITPMLQVIKQILQNPDDRTSIHLVFSNKNEVDILLRNELDDLASKHPNFQVTYVLSRLKDKKSWKGFIGHIDSSIIAACMPPPSPDNLIYVCGPPGFMETISGNKAPDYTQGPVEGLLKSAGYTG